jgi:hypothetical protein
MPLIVRSRASIRRAGLGIVGLAALAMGCRRPPESRDTPSNGGPPDLNPPARTGEEQETPAPAVAAAAASTSVGATPTRPPIPGWIHPARRVKLPDSSTPTTRDAFLQAHGVKRDRPDATCFFDGIMICECDRSIAVQTQTTTIDVLVCEKFPDPPPEAVLSGHDTRTVLYTVDHGAPKVLLDVPTRGTFEPELSDGNLVGNVELLVIPSADGVTLVDIYETDSGPWCPQAIARAGTQKGREWAVLRRTYAATCASAGRYILKNGRLVKTAAGTASGPPAGVPMPLPTTTAKR